MISSKCNFYKVMAPHPMINDRSLKGFKVKVIFKSNGIYFILAEHSRPTDDQTMVIT